MKNLILIIFILKLSHADVSLVSFSNAQPGDSLILKAKELKRLYLLSTASSSDLSDNYKRQFFDAFPNTFKQLDELYGDNFDIHHKAAPLNNQAEQHIINLFNNLNCIKDTLYYRKIIQVSIDGHWDADAVNYFQSGLRERVLAKPELTIYVLRHIPNDKVRSFWYFYFDGLYPKKQIPEQLLRIKSIDNNIYDLMIEAHNEVLKHSKE